MINKPLTITNISGICFENPKLTGNPKSIIVCSDVETSLCLEPRLHKTETSVFSALWEPEGI